MKFLTLILATLILLLAVKPGVDTLLLQAGAEQTCCGGQCTPTSDNDNSKDQSKNKDCGGKSCNPIQACSICVLICSNLPSFDFKIKYPVLTEKLSTYKSAIPSQFTSDFWQPPKIV